MVFFELDATDLSALSASDLRELVARLCEAELIEQQVSPACVLWGGAQEAPDGGLDVHVKQSSALPRPQFVPNRNSGFQVKKNTMGKAACQIEMQEASKPKPILRQLAALHGSYIIVSGKDNCSGSMLTHRLEGMQQAVKGMKGRSNLHLDFYGPDRLATWLRRHPAVAIWVRSCLGKPLAGWHPYGRWAATPPEQDDTFLVDALPSVIDANSSTKSPMPVMEGLQLARDRLREPGSTARITGLSGVGKTRFAQALFEPNVGTDPLPASDVIYADLGEQLIPTATELLTYLIANDFSTYLVLDNCPPDIHRKLRDQVQASSAHVRLLTVEYDISDDKPELTAVIHLEPTSVETVSKLVQRRYPELGTVNANRIAEFAGGNARIALALASRVDPDETLSNFHDEDLFRRLFSQRKGDSAELLERAETLSLVYSFCVSPKEFNDELHVLGDIAGISRKALHRAQGELLRRQLAQQRGQWRAVLPHALSNRLARRALENISPQDINGELFKPENIRLFQSCAHRLGYLHDCPAAQTLARSWMDAGAPLSDIATCSEKLLVVLDFVAPVFPDVVLSAIEKAATHAGFASRSNAQYIRFVRLLSHLAYEDGMFDRATTLLLTFAETERNDENDNSIVGNMRQLFSLHLSGTEATPDRRQAFVQRLLTSSNPRHREIAQELLSSAFEAHNWTAFGAFHFGARKRGFGWRPKTSSERLAWYVGFLNLLRPFLASTSIEDQEWAKKLLAKHFRSLWSFAKCFDALEDLVATYGKSGSWTEVWISIKQAISFDAERFSRRVLSRVQSLERITAPTDAYSEIEAYVLVDAYDHVHLGSGEHQEQVKRIYEKVVKLGELTATQLEYIDRFGCKLWTSRAQPIFWFAQGLAVGTADPIATFDKLVSSLLSCKDAAVDVRLLEGFVHGVQELDPKQSRRLLEHALQIPELQPFFVRLLTAVPIHPWISRELTELARGGQLSAQAFEQVAYGRRHETMPDADLATLLNQITSLPDGFLSVLRILQMRFFEKVSRNYTPSDEVRSAARAAVRGLVAADRRQLEQARITGMASVFQEAFSPPAPDADIKEIIKLLCDGVGEYRLYGFEMPELISAVLLNYPEWLLDAVFDGGPREQGLCRLLFKDHSYRIRSSLNEASLSRVMAWCGNNQERILKVAGAMHSYVASEKAVDQNHFDEHPKQIVLSKQCKALLEASTDKLAVLEIIFEHIQPNSWSGSLASIYEIRTSAFAELLEHPDPAVREFVKTKVSLMKQRIEAQRQHEAEEHTEREQRFE